MSEFTAFPIPSVPLKDLPVSEFPANVGGSGHEKLQPGETLQQALTRLGTVNQHVLQLTAPVELTTDIVIPNNIAPIADSRAYFTSANGSTLTIENGAGFYASLTQHVFRGNMKVKFTNSYPDKTSWHWFGAKNDGVTDVLPAFNAVLDSFRNNNAFATVSGTATGGDIYMAEGEYYSSDTWVINKRVSIKGKGGRAFGKIHIQWAPNKTLIRVDSSYTDVVQPQPYARDGGESDIEGLTLAGALTFVADCNAALNGLTLTAQGAENAQLFKWREGWQSGQMVVIGGLDGLRWMIGNSPNNTNVLQLRPYRATGINYAANQNQITVNLINNLPAVYHGATINLYPVDDGTNRYTQKGKITTTIQSSAGQVWTLATNIPNIGGYLIEIVSVPSFTAPIMLSNYHGIDLRTGANVRNNFIRFVGGNGVYCGDRFPTTAPETQPNTNNGLIELNEISYCHGSGVYAKGLNQNNMSIYKNRVDYNWGVGIYDDSFLGNDIYNNHSSFNFQGGIVGGFNGGHSTRINYHYSEGGEPPVKVGNDYKVVDGTLGAGYDLTDSQFYIEGGDNNGYAVITAMKAVRPSTYGTIIKTLGSSNYQNVIESFGEATDAESINAGTGASFHWRVENFGSATSPQMHFQLIYGAISQGVLSGTVLIDLPCSTANGGGYGNAGDLVFPNGFVTKSANGTFYRVRVNNAGTGFDITPV